MKPKTLLIIFGATLTVVVIKQQIDIHYLTEALDNTLDYLQQKEINEQFAHIIQSNDMGDLGDDSQE
jgi:hypothetical protein